MKKPIDTSNIKLIGYVLVAIVTVCFLLIDDVNLLLPIGLVSFSLYMAVLAFYLGKMNMQRKQHLNRNTNSNKELVKTNTNNMDSDTAMELKELLNAGIIDLEEYKERLKSNM